MINSITDLNKGLFFQIFDLSKHNFMLDTLMVFFADYLIFICFFLVVFSWFKKDINNKKGLLLSILSLMVGFLIIKSIVFIYFEPRPFITYPIVPLINHAADDSFPSDHTSILAILTFSFLFYKTRLSKFLLLSTILTGFSRIYVGVHYPLDILGGFLVGILSVSISWKIKNYIVSKLG